MKNSSNNLYSNLNMYLCQSEVFCNENYPNAPVKLPKLQQDYGNLSIISKLIHLRITHISQQRKIKNS